MLTTNWKGLLLIILMAVSLILIVLAIEFLFFKFLRRKKQEFFQRSVIWGEAIILFSLFQWYIAIFLWLGSFLIDCYIFKRISSKTKSKMKKIDYLFLTEIFLSSLLCICLPQIFVEIELLGIVLGYTHSLWLQYLNNALGIAGILFAVYLVGFRPWRCQGDRFVSVKRKPKDKLDVFDKYADNILCVIVFLLVQIVYAFIYFN